jgi:hypothetical protein
MARMGRFQAALNKHVICGVEVSKVITDVHTPWAWSTGELKPEPVAGAKVDSGRLSDLPRGWQKIEIPEASPDGQIPDDAGAIPQEMGRGVRMSKLWAI